MPITTCIDPKSGLRTHRVEGRLVLVELSAELQRIYDLPEFRPDGDVLWDCRDAQLNAFTGEEVQRVADFVSRHWGVQGSARAALVVSRDVDYGLCRMYQTLLSGRNQSEVRIFRDLDEARAWLAEWESGSGGPPG